MNIVMETTDQPGRGTGTLEGFHKEGLLLGADVRGLNFIPINVPLFDQPN